MNVSNLFNLCGGGKLKTLTQNFLFTHRKLDCAQIKHTADIYCFLFFGPDSPPPSGAPRSSYPLFTLLLFLGK